MNVPRESRALGRNSVAIFTDACYEAENLVWPCGLGGVLCFEGEVLLVWVSFIDSMARNMETDGAGNIIMPSPEVKTEVLFGPIPKEFTIDMVLPFVGIPASTECELSEVAHLARVPFHMAVPPPLSELPKFWAPHEELDENHRWWIHTTDASLYRDIVNAVERDLPDKVADLSADGTDNGMIRHTFVTVKQLPLMDLMDLTGRLSDVTRQQDDRITRPWCTAEIGWARKDGSLENDGDDQQNDLEADSIDSEAVHVPLPSNIDLFGGSEVESLHLDLTSEVSQGDVGKATSFDGYFDPADDVQEEVDPADLRSFSSLIRDRCLAVPPALSVKLPWETGVMQQVFSEDDGLPDLPIPQMGGVDVGDNPEEAPKSLPCSWQECGRGVYLGVINFKVNLSEAELEQKSWGDALEVVHHL
eukprot:s2261_g15.t1